MKRNKVLIYTLLLLGICAASCSKWLELKPQDGIVGDEFWQTKEQVAAAVTGIYASMLGTSADNELPLTEYLFLWGEARADMVTTGFSARAEENDMVIMNILPANRFTRWSTVYQTINYCNTVIELAPGVLQRDNTFTEAQLKRAVAEAKTIRALMYFILARVFGEAPLKLDATKSDENIQHIAKSDQNTLLNQVVADLKAAEPDVPLTYGNINFDKGRVTRYTVNALLADVYLWMEKYAECVTECNKIINSKQFGLIGGDLTNNTLFNELYYQGNSTESIFELQFDAQKLNPFFAMHVSVSRRWGAAPHLMEEVFGIDVVNNPPMVDLRGEGTSLRPSDLTIWKYIGGNSTGSALRTFDQSYAHWIFYRYADVLLMKAEAINQLNQPLEASRIVKTIRERAHAFDFNGTMDSTSKSNMEGYILEERQREFAFEGKRWFDVLRNAKRNNYQNLQYLLNMAAISVPSDRQQVAFNKLKDKNSHYLPINLTEMQTNKLLVQNPFYK